MSYRRRDERDSRCGKIAVLTGRYDIVHPGHIKTIVREARRFDKLYVVVWSNAHGRSYPAEWAQELIAMATPDNVRVLLSPVHFGYAYLEDVYRLPAHDVILCGNARVFYHIKDLGIKNVEMIDEEPGYSSSGVKLRVVGPSEAD